MNTDNRDTRGIILNVPYAEKDQAKSLGARWCPDLKKWFIPKGIEAKPFSKWFPDGAAPSQSTPR